MDIQKLVNKCQKKFEASEECFMGTHTLKRLRGDIYEIQIRESIKKLLPDYKVGYGVVENKTDKNNISNAIDVIIYKGKETFRVGDLCSVPADIVKAVIEIKVYFTSYKKELEGIKNNLNSAYKLNKNIKKFCFVGAVMKNYMKTFQNDFKNNGQIRTFSHWYKENSEWLIFSSDDKRGFYSFFNILKKEV